MFTGGNLQRDVLHYRQRLVGVGEGQPLQTQGSAFLSRWAAGREADLRLPVDDLLHPGGGSDHLPKMLESTSHRHQRFK
ncbi:hypothetical protein D3C79_982270 [compost metagenome]